LSRNPVTVAGPRRQGERGAQAGVCIAERKITAVQRRYR
jgi:hypothetical protein